MKAFSVERDSYPRYEEDSSEHVRRFLNGEYGHNLDPKVASFLYAIDRAAGAAAVKGFLADDPLAIQIMDRYTASNFGHNGSKYDTIEERLEFFEYQRHFEHDVLGIPQPHHSFIFQIPPEVAQQNIDKKAKRNYTDKKRDIHEADANHLQRTFETYELLADTYPDEFTIMNPMESAKKMRPIEEIHEELYARVKQLLNLTQPSKL